MYLLTLKTRKEDGAYAVQDRHGDKVLFLFEEEDDAELKDYLYGEENSDEDSRPDMDGFDGLELV